jgi:hypothetical protein
MLTLLVELEKNRGFVDSGGGKGRNDRFFYRKTINDA